MMTMTEKRHEGHARHCTSRSCIDLPGTDRVDILAGWGLVASIIFAFASLREGEPATLRAVISMAGWAIAVVAPAISMRSFAEEARLGTLEVLMTSPLSALELVLGKFLAGVGVLLVLGIPILVLFGVAEIYGNPDPGELGSGLLGLLLAGATLIALGLLVSTRTSSQVVAYLVTFFLFFAVILIAKGVPALIELLPADLLAPGQTLAWIEWTSGLDPLLRLDEFAIGLFDSANLGWFIAVAVFFLFAGGVSLAAPRRIRPATRSGRAIALFFSATGVLGAGVAAVAFSVLLESPHYASRRISPRPGRIRFSQPPLISSSSLNRAGRSECWSPEMMPIR